MNRLLDSQGAISTGIARRQRKSSHVFQIDYQGPVSSPIRNGFDTPEAVICRYLLQESPCSPVSLETGTPQPDTLAPIHEMK